MSEFIRPIDTYKREYDFKNIAFEDLATFLARSRGLSLDEAKAYLGKQMTPQGAFPLNNPEALI